MSSTVSPDEQQRADQARKLHLEIENLERGKRWWNKITQYLPLITTVIAIAAFVFGFIQYRDNQERDFKRTFLGKQMDLYLEISNSAARLAVLDDSDERNKEFIHFKVLYHGDLRMVADRKVFDETQKFFNKYINLQSDQTKQGDIEKESRELARVCRESLRETWDVNLPTLPEKP